MSRKFNQFRFSGLNYKTNGPDRWTMDRVSEDETKIVVRVAVEQLFETKYGFALILDRTHVCFVKGWAVSDEEHGACEVMLDKEYFKAKERGTNYDFFDDPENLPWDRWVEVAKAQRDAGTEVAWVHPEFDRSWLY